MSLVTRILTSAHLLDGIAPASVQAIVTSSPYYRLRRYRVPDVDWPAVTYRPLPGLDFELTIPAWRGQLGWEESVEAFIGHLILCLRRWREILRPDGTVWFNLGDSYAQDSKWGGRSGDKNYTSALGGAGRERVTTGIPDKNLLLIPYRLALATQGDGWRVRNIVPWVKTNGLPGPWDDRLIVGHEDILLLTPAPDYYFDHIAIRRPGAGYQRKGGRAAYTAEGATTHGVGSNSFHQMAGEEGRNARTGDFWRDSVSAIAEALAAEAAELQRLLTKGGPLVDDDGNLAGIQVNPEALREEHYAPWPRRLARIMLKASTSEAGACSRCGAPRRRVIVDHTPKDHPELKGESKYQQVGPQDASRRLSMARDESKRQGYELISRTATVGWRPTCVCGAPDGFRPDDLEIVASPLNRPAAEERDDPSLDTGRAGFGRERDEAEGQRPMTRYEQRQYAAQLKDSPHRQAMAEEAGKEAFAHYRRTDRTGARPIPPALLAAWLERSWLVPVELPSWDYPPTVPCLVLDPFAGSGTTGEVAVSLGLRVILVDASPEYLDGLAAGRTENVQMELL